MRGFAIGMFDSGLGGLTVLKEVKGLLPEEHIIYLGDTARVPYGNKSPHTITKYALESAIFLLTKGVKMLVIACNTSSALALNILKRRLPVPVIGVIEPGARRAAGSTNTKRVAVIGTRATIQSRAYEKAIRRMDASIEVTAKSCPLFVPIVEEGLEKDEVACLMAQRYLADLGKTSIDTLVMGCTHYPVMEEVIRSVVGEDISIVNTGRETAKEVERILERKEIVNTAGAGGCEYFVTDSPETFKEVGGRFLGETIEKITFLKGLDYKDYLLSP